VIDSPPLPILADTIPLAKMVKGVIVVGRVNKTTRDEAQALHAQLESLEAPVLGVVANRTPRGRGYYGYYRQGHRSAAAARTNRNE
jgi:Mrp family chromosome partitioning ATPase